MVTAAHAERTFLHPALDAQAANAHQDRLIYDPTPEVDSLAEHLREALKGTTGPARQHLRSAFALLTQVAHANHAERDHEQTIGGAADHLVTSLRRAERVTGTKQLTAKGVARALRDPLGRTEPGAPMTTAVIADLREIHRVADQVTLDLLLSGAVQHELGDAKFERLAEIVSARLETAA